MLRNLGLLILSFAFLLQCSLPEPDDITPPVSRVIFPYEGAVVSSDINITIEASDDDAVDKVWCFVDGVKIGETSRNPFSIPLNITTYEKDVNHVLQAAAQDKEGNIGYAAVINFIISDTPDIVDPVVSIVNPQNGQVVEGIVNITANAVDERSIRKVAFFIDGDSLGETADYPYIFNWQTSGYSDSTDHTIFAKAFDGGNNSAVSPVVTVTVYPRTGPAGDNEAPEVIILYPVAGSSVSGTVQASVSLQDNAGVTRAEFYVDGTLQESASNPGNPWIFNWDTSPWANGQSHTLYVKASDAAGNLSTSGLMTVTVSGPISPESDTEAPDITLLYPVAGSTITGSVQVAVDLEDNVGVTKSEFYVDGVLQSSADNPVSPWTFNWNTSAWADSNEHSLYIKALDEAGNLSTSGLTTVTVQ